MSARAGGRVSARAGGGVPARAGRGRPARAGDGVRARVGRGVRATALPALLALALGGCAAGPLAPPGRLAGLEATRVVRGADAIAEVSGLHGRGVTVREAVVGEYGDGGVTLWVAAAADAGAARGMERAMVERIRTVANPFTPTGVRRLRGREVHELTGMGQRHAWFRSGRLVVWVAADSSYFDAALAATLARWR